MQSLDTTYVILKLLLCLVLVAGFAYITIKLIVNMNLLRCNNKNMKIIEIISVAPQKSLELVKVANKVILIAITKDNISLIDKFDLSEIDIDDIKFQQDKIKFTEVFKNALKRNK